MASPNSVFFNIYKHLLSSASPEISLHAPSTLSHSPSCPGRALEFWNQEQQHPRAGPCPEPTHRCHPVLHTRPQQSLCLQLAVLCLLRCWCDVCAPCPFTSQRPLPQTAVYIETLSSELTFHSRPKQFSVRVVCSPGNSASLSWDQHSWEEDVWSHRQLLRNRRGFPARNGREWLFP